MKSRLLICVTTTAVLTALEVPARLAAQEAPTYTVLYTFTGGADGGYSGFGFNPVLVEDEKGNLYGTTDAGGDLSCTGYYGQSGCGTVFKLDPTGKETVLYSFTGGADGQNPPAGLVRDREGNLYGTAFAAGDLSGCGLGGGGGCGVVFKVDRTGKFTVLYSFTGGDGAFPSASLIRDPEGNLYGTTNEGGASGNGVVFKLGRTGKETVLYSFSGGADGGFPYAGLVRDKEGNLYGTTFGGGDVCSGTRGCGVVFKVDPAGKETVLYSFTGGADGGSLGASPLAGLVRDEEGNLYGTTPVAGASRRGVVFKLDPSGKETVLYSFTGGADGAIPQAGLLRDKAGNLYGTTLLGGASGNGVVFKVDPAGKETVLYSFTGGADGANPQSGLFQDKAGNLYGTTEFGGDTSCNFGSGCGVVFEIKMCDRDRTDNEGGDR